MIIPLTPSAPLGDTNVSVVVLSLAVATLYFPSPVLTNLIGVPVVLFPLNKLNSAPANFS